MKVDPTVPVYLITGFLDGGKTNFLKYTMEQEYFNDGSQSLLLVTEEGEEEYTPDFLKKTKTQMVVIDEEAALTREYLAEIAKSFKADRVLIELNGMWSVKNFLMIPLPKYWMIYQIITIFDGENFGLYLNNIKATAMELLTNTDMVIFNRCNEKTDLVLYQRTLRSVNRKCDLVFENENGEELECPEPDLPYELDQPFIDISDDNYGTFYIDLSEHPERYEGKEIGLLIQVMQAKEFPKNVFVGGRRAMTCCEADIRFLPYIFIYDKARSLAHEAWAKVKATVKWEYHEGYGEKGPVFYLNEVKLANPPKDQLVYF